MTTETEKEMAVDHAAGPDKSVPDKTISAEDIQAALRRTCEKTSHTRKPALVCIVCGHVVFTEPVKKGPSRRERRRKERKR